MPYTFVHPVFLMPLKRRFQHLFNTSALVMGSIAPDLDIIYRFTETRHHIFDYSISNISLVILPIAIIMSIYMRLLMIPVYTTGKTGLSRSQVTETLRSLPSIVVSALAAILIHVLLDHFTHIDDIIVKAKYHAENLGREPDDYHDFYQLMMYGPTLLVSFIGMMMALYYAYIYRKHWWNATAFIRKYLSRWSFAIVLLTISFSLLKHITVGVEDNMRLDSYAISITCGLLSAFLLSPVLFYVQQLLVGERLRKFMLSHDAWYLALMPVFAFYLSGIPDTEWLRDFTGKGLFLFGMSALIMATREVVIDPNTGFKVLKWVVGCLMMAAYILLTKISPVWSWVKLFLAIQGGLVIACALARISDERSLLGPLLHILSGGAVLFVLAYYFSDKGLGPGILVIFSTGILMGFRDAMGRGMLQIHSKWMTVATIIESILLLVLFLNLSIASSGMLLSGLLFTWFRRWGLADAEWSSRFNILYFWWAPLAGMVFIAAEHSLSYGLLSLCAYLIFFPFAPFQFARFFRKGTSTVVAETISD